MRSGTWKLCKFLLKTGSLSAGNGVKEKFRYRDLSEDDNVLLLLLCGSVEEEWQMQTKVVPGVVTPRQGPGDTTST